MVFNSTREFKWAVEYHDALRHKDVKFKKNEARRVRVVCRHNNTCKWSIFGSKSNPNCPFTIKTYNQVHSCGNQDENKVVTSGFLAKFFKDDFRVNTDWGRGPFQEHVKAKFNYGCHLKGSQKGGQLLSAIGLDSDNSIFPVAFAIVEGHALKMQFWAVCKANTEAEYHARMEEIKTLNVKAFEWRWDLTGIPCSHAIAAIRKKGDLPELYVHQCYSVEQYLRAYGPAILPIRAEEL
nr:Zinc knuckle family protein [Ipomoea batatas]